VPTAAHLIVRILKVTQLVVLRLVLTLILFAGLISASFAQDKILVEGKGFRDLLVGSSKVDDVIRFLGKPDRVEETKAEYSRNYVYSAAGLKLNFHDDTLNTITTMPSFNGKTSKGITLRSSLQDIEKTYGSPLVEPGKTKDNATTWVYDGVIFWFERSWISTSFDRIDKIVIYDKSFRRSKR
jgi:Domain of unknown function (DUF4309)